MYCKVRSVFFALWVGAVLSRNLFVMVEHFRVSAIILRL